MSEPILQQAMTPLINELLDASKAAERLISALFEVGALDGEPFITTWCQLDRAIDKTERALNPKLVTRSTTANPGQPAA